MEIDETVDTEEAKELCLSIELSILDNNADIDNNLIELGLPTNFKRK